MQGNNQVNPAIHKARLKTGSWPYIAKKVNPAIHKARLKTGS